MTVGLSSLVGKRLKLLRENKNVSQEVVAQFLGIARTTYTKYELGDSEADYAGLKRLANFFGVTVDYLLGNTEIPHLTEQEDTPVSQYDLKSIRHRIANKNVIDIPLSRIPFLLDGLDKELSIIVGQTFGE